MSVVLGQEGRALYPGYLTLIQAFRHYSTFFSLFGPSLYLCGTVKIMAISSTDDGFYESVGNAKQN